MYFVYKYIHQNEIIYIGKTSNLYNRHMQHKNSTIKNLENYTLHYLEFKNEHTASYVESYLIGLHKPVLNSQYIETNFHEELDISFKQKFKEFTQETIDSIKITNQDFRVLKYDERKMRILWDSNLTNCSFRVDRDSLYLFGYMENYKISHPYHYYDLVNTQIKNNLGKLEDYLLLIQDSYRSTIDDDPEFTHSVRLNLKNYKKLVDYLEEFDFNSNNYNQCLDILKKVDSFIKKAFNCDLDYLSDRIKNRYNYNFQFISSSDLVKI